MVTFDAISRTASAFDARASGQVLTFVPSDSVPNLLEDSETGSLWTHYGEAVDGPLAGTNLQRLTDAYALFWFAWSVFHPETELVQ